MKLLTYITVVIFATCLIFLTACSGKPSGVAVGDTTTVENEVNLRAGTDRTSDKYNYNQANGSELIRLWVREDGSSNGSFSKYSSDVARNIGSINPETLETKWYFESNNQHITRVSELFHTLDDQEKVWKGSIFSVVSIDADNDGRLTSKDKKNLYYAHADSFVLLFENADSIEQVFTNQTSAIVMIRQDEDLYAQRVDFENIETLFVKKVELPL